MNKIILLFSLALLLSGCNRARQEQGQEDDDVTIDLPQLKAQDYNRTTTKTGGRLSHHHPASTESARRNNSRHAI